MLVGLSESQIGQVAEDAQAFLRAAMAKEWFTTTEPKYYELERIAEKSVTKYRRQPDRTKVAMAIAMGLALMVAFMGVFVFMGGSEIELSNAPVMIAVVVMTVGVLAVWMTKKGR